MLSKKDRRYARKRKRLWDVFGWIYRSVNSLSKNHSLNCGCSMCCADTYYKRYERRQDRHKAKQKLKEWQNENEK